SAVPSPPHAKAARSAVSTAARRVPRRPRHTLFLFQAEDGIRDRNVTGVQTCALPISGPGVSRRSPRVCTPETPWPSSSSCTGPEIGRASCRERVQSSGGSGPEQQKTARNHATTPMEDWGYAHDAGAHGSLSTAEEQTV